MEKIMKAFPYKRVAVIGCPGGGKSTFSRALRDRVGLPLYHLDAIYWRDDRTHLSREEFYPLMQEIIAREEWIMDGNFNRTMPERIKRCDTIIYLDFSRVVCLMGVVKRVITTYGTVRPDMGEGCPERIDFEFMKWVWNFNKNKRESYYKMLNEVEGIETIVLKNRCAVKLFLKSLNQT